MSALYTDNRNKVTLGDIMQEALKAAGKSSNDVTVSPKHATQRVSSYDVTWNHELLGTLKLAVDGYNIAWENSETEGHSYSQLIVKDQPSHLNVRMAVELQDGVRLWYVDLGTRVRNFTRGDLPIFQVPVDWNNSGVFEDSPKVPHTRRTDIDNIDVIFEDSTGRFIQVQISITTRKGKFYLNLQEIYAGHIARTTTVNAKRLGKRYHKIDQFHVAIVVPLFAHHAYPDADYLKTWDKIGNQLIAESLKDGRSVRLSEATYAEWQMPNFPTPKREGNLTGVVAFFNVVIGWGYLLDKEGKMHFLHFKSLRHEYLPKPTELYEFTPRIENGKSKAYNAVRIKQVIGQA